MTPLEFEAPTFWITSGTANQLQIVAKLMNRGCAWAKPIGPKTWPGQVMIWARCFRMNPCGHLVERHEEMQTQRAGKAIDSSSTSEALEGSLQDRMLYDENGS